MLPSARFTDHRVGHVELCHPYACLCQLQRIVGEAVRMPLLGEVRNRAFTSSCVADGASPSTSNARSSSLTPGAAGGGGAGGA